MKKISIFWAMVFMFFGSGVGAYAEDTTISVMRYEQDCFDFETGTIIGLDQPPFDCPDHGDFHFAYHADRTPHAVIFQNQCVGSQCEQGVQIAYSTEAYPDVTWNDLNSLEFTRDLIDTPFTEVAVLFTPAGNYYKLELVEDVISCDNSLCASFRWAQLQVQSHDVAITKLSAPRAAKAGQTRQIVIRVKSKQHPEEVEVQLFKSVPGGFQMVDALTQVMPLEPSNQTTRFKFNYTFTGDDANAGEVTFKAVANIVGTDDALPADNEAIAAPTKVKP